MTPQVQDSLPPVTPAARQHPQSLLKASDELACLLINESVFPRVAFVVEASSFERYMLWSRNDEQVLWRENISGMMKKVGEVTIKGPDGEDTLPVMLSLWFSAINGHLVMFYQATSQVVDHRLVDAWLTTNIPALSSSQLRTSCDAMNFHLCLRHLRELTRQQEAADVVSAAFA